MPSCQKLPAHAHESRDLPGSWAEVRLDLGWKFITCPAYMLVQRHETQDMTLRCSGACCAFVSSRRSLEGVGLAA